jgi:hypothetical protein
VISVFVPLIKRYFMKRFPMALLLSALSTYLISISYQLDFMTALYMCLIMMMLSFSGWSSGVSDGSEFMLSYLKEKVKETK